MLAAACDRKAAAPPIEAPPGVTKIDCGDEVISVAVADELALDDAVCGGPWHAWQIETRRTIELVRRVPGRTVWLRRRGREVVVELRVGERVTSTFASPARILWVKPAGQEVADVITLTRGAASEQVTLERLLARYPGGQGGDSGGGSAGGRTGTGGGSGNDRRRGREISLCVLLEGADPTATVEVRGAPPEPPQAFTRAACERDGLLLHASRRGGIQLRDRTKRRYVAAVKQITVR